MNNQIVTINLVPGRCAPAVVRVSQYDVGRPLTFKVLDGTSNMTLPSGTTATIEGTKPSGLGFSVTGTLSGNTVTVDTTIDMTQESGMIAAEIRFTQGTTDIGTANFVIAVEKTPHAEGTTDGTQESMANLETRLQGQIDALDSRIDAIEGDQSIVDELDALDARVTALEQGGSGLTQAEKQLILTLFCKAAYAEDDAGVVYDALEALWATTTRTITYNLSHVSSSNTTASIENGQSYTTSLTASTNYMLNSVTVTMGGVDITATAYSSGTITIPSVTGNIVITATAVLAAQSITATYTQSGTVYDTDSLDSLKADLVVTANYAGGTSETVPASDYTLSGTLTEGTSVITVSYSGLTTTFNVTVSGQPISDDYDEWTTEYQHTILQARDAWASEYRTDSTIVPLVISTDQHGTLSGQWAKDLYSYLSLAVKWSECSACLNLGDVVASSYDETALNAMVSTLEPIPKAKQINLVGNHDTWGAWTRDTSLDAPTQAFWSSLLSFFDNSGFNGYVRLGTHQTAEYMIDTAKKIRYVVVGGWDYNKQIGGHSHYLIDSDNLDAIISALSAVDDKDIILLSHIQPFNGTLQYGHDVWQLPAVDGNEATSEDRVIEPMVNRAETTLNALFNARKAKTSGTVNDSYGNSHSFDFTNCTSDLLCTLHGHWHEDLYNWYGNNNIPTVLFDSMHYDNHPFYFVNVDRTRQRLSIWKVDDSPTFYHYTIHFEKAVNT